MASQDDNLSFQQLSVLDLLKSHIQSQKDAIATLEGKAQNNFTIINIIVAIVAALNIELGAAENFHQIISERPLLPLIFVGYVIVVVLSLHALVIRRQASVPMEVSLRHAQDWSECDLDHHVDILVRSYIEIYKYNDRIVKLKGRSIQWAYTTIGAVIAFIFVEALGMLPVLTSWFLRLVSALTLVFSSQYLGAAGTTFVCVLFLSSRSARFILQSRMKAGALASVKHLVTLANRFRRSQ